MCAKLEPAPDHLNISRRTKCKSAIFPEKYGRTSVVLLRRSSLRYDALPKLSHPHFQRAQHDRSLPQSYAKGHKIAHSLAVRLESSVSQPSVNTLSFAPSYERERVALLRLLSSSMCIQKDTADNSLRGVEIEVSVRRLGRGKHECVKLEFRGDFLSQFSLELSYLMDLSHEFSIHIPLFS